MGEGMYRGLAQNTYASQASGDPAPAPSVHSAHQRTKAACSFAGEIRSRLEELAGVLDGEPVGQIVASVGSSGSGFVGAVQLTNDDLCDTLNQINSLVTRVRRAVGID